MCSEKQIYATATIYGGAVECEEGRGGCGTVVRGGPGLAGGGGGRPLCELEVWASRAAAALGRLALAVSRKQRQLVLSH